MRKLAWMLLFAVAGNCQAAEWADWPVRGNTLGEWIAVERRENLVVYANADTIRKSNDGVQMWGLTDFSSDSGAPVKGVRSLKSEREYDCNRQQMRVLYISRHSGNMGAGDIIGSDSNSGGWQPVMLGTIGERLWRIACGKR